VVSGIGRRGYLQEAADVIATFDQQGGNVIGARVQERLRALDGELGGRSAKQTTENFRSPTNDANSTACMRVPVISMAIGRPSSRCASIASATSWPVPDYLRVCSTAHSLVGVCRILCRVEDNSRTIRG
jgi:hypothetical protein